MKKVSKQGIPRTYDNYKEERLDKARRSTITKANALIQKSRYSLSLMEQKIVLFCISKITENDTFLKEYTFSIMEYCAVCGIAATNYETIKASLLKLKRKSFWITIDDTGTESIVDWFGVVRINPKSGFIKVKFHEDMFPFLLELRKNFTTFSIYPTLVMKSRYSIRLYELLKSYSNLSEWTFDIEKLKKKLDANYSNFFDFRRRVLDISVTEINEYTDLEISYKPIKEYSRSFNKITFFISQKAPAFVLEADKKVEKQLDGQLSFNADEEINIGEIKPKGKREAPEALLEQKKRGRPRKEKVTNNG